VIEVLNGKVFNIKEKKFMATSDVLKPSDLGSISPRTFIYYNPDQCENPKPKIFINFLENSFPGEVQRRAFLRKYYQCLCAKELDHKTRKLCVVGNKDSGKTSLLAPLQGIIPLDKIATLTREKQFSAQMICEDTELVFVDEWSPQTLDAESAKKLLQGGYFVTAVKHKVNL
jgi:hypothetical protein